MKDLTLRLSALDPEAGAALRAITYLDTLAATHPGLSAVLRGVVTLTGAAAGIIDARHHLTLRIDEHGRTQHHPGPPDQQWLKTPAGTDGAVLWIERRAPARTIDAVVLERAAILITEVLERTRGQRHTREQTQRWERVLLDVGAEEDTRRHAARQLRLPLTGTTRAVALPGGNIHIQAVIAKESGPTLTGRAGVGPAVPVLELPDSWPQAQLALRLTAEGTPEDPGPRTVYADQMGGLALLAQYVGPNTPLTPDELALQRAAGTAPWMLPTLECVASASSLRAAAAQLMLHHSSLQERLIRAEKTLGWPVTATHGRLRLQLALVLRRLHRPHEL